MIKNIIPEETHAPVAPAAPAVKASPTVQSAAVFHPGDKVKHLNGTIYSVRYQTPEGVALEFVANLVNPETLTIVK